MVANLSVKVVVGTLMSLIILTGGVVERGHEGRTGPETDVPGTGRGEVLFLEKGGRNGKNEE